MSQSLYTDTAKRVGTALFFGPLAVAVVLLANRLFFSFFVLLVALICTYEMTRNILKLRGGEVLLSHCAAFLCFVPYIMNRLNPVPLFLCLIFLCLFASIFKSNSKWLEIWHVFIPLIYIALPLSLLIELWSDAGRKAVLFLLLVVWISDISAYFVGSYMGKRPLFPRISPKKTVEGLIGALFFSAVFSVPLGFFLLDTGASKSLVLGLVVTISGAMGDLVESSMKRHASIKDTSNILPGHGGLLDRFDSTIFSIPFFLIALKLIK